ncbi:MAG: YkgJ family cysteine cluster protein [Azospirillum sp.]|nr:YkgJ family cysteine cluster protein [Azospirillum sp.]
MGAADGVTDAVEAVDDDSAVDCETCGCCCAFSWEWPTFVGDRDGEGIPEYLTEDGRMRCDGDRCAALFGTVGVEVHCRVYPDRPLVCREFAAGSPACRAVRRHFGLGQGTAR